MFTILLLERRKDLVSRQREAIRGVELHHFGATAKHRPKKFDIESVKRATASVQESKVGIGPALADIRDGEFSRIYLGVADVLKRNFGGPTE
jgi:hypothetical protein